ncbi:beta-1,4-N-acetylgalactosaminyltransferase bre-4-like [Pectinophora gossypiella]|uniref:beta-1,4-N-acetylgalactosaminyltransferase bre-4-like n=1 Tax=Pectinophora gossypiella TaxID=13191 RepID=UPI00214E34C1|nr:beta-1,4-N-acetylgalactosaminyltransferase bre-4-like [Pectinophora gossypiella]
MAKPSALSRALALPLTSCIAAALALITVVQFFATNGTYNYSYIPLSSLETELYKQVNPKLVLKQNKPTCNYEEIVKRTDSINNWEVPEKFDNFSPAGIVNGSYTPTDCNPQFSVAILVTYRNRQKQLDVFLPYMHNFLRKQNIHYKIYVIEQQDEKPWNKGTLYNIGAKYAIAEKFPCLILHDVDLLPLSSGTLYACMRAPRHMSASIDKFRFVLPYPELVGGVLAVRADHYTRLNGFSNRFQHWGGEDDDFYARIKDEQLGVVRFPRQLSQYTMLVHQQEPVNGDVWRVLRDNRRRAHARDGLSSAAYDSVRLAPHRLFTLLAVKL